MRPLLFGLTLCAWERPAESARSSPSSSRIWSASPRRRSSSTPRTWRRSCVRITSGCATSSKRWGGTVEKFIGDAVVAFFGAPVAGEDDPERAVRAALAIRDWIADEGTLQVRIAVNTGEALV